MSRTDGHPAPQTGTRWGVAAAVAAAVVAADQATKSWALATLQGAAARTVVPGFFDLSFNRNTGAVFGIFAGAPSAGRRVFFVVATSAALAMIAFLLRRWGRESRTLFAGLCLVAGGAVGNLVDRLRFGSVVDFIDWHWRAHHWPTFNVADSAISVGAALILLQSVLPERRTAPPEAAREA